MSFPILMSLLAVLLGLACFGGARLGRFGLEPRMAGGALIWAGLSLAAALYVAVGLHQSRIEYIHDECDSIGHVYRVLQVLPRNERAQMRLLLVSYTDTRLRKVSEAAASDGAQAEEEAMGLYSQMFALATRMIKSKTVDAYLGSQITQGLSRMISSHHRLGYALEERVAAPLLAFSALMCLLSAGLLGALAATAHPGQRWVGWALVAALWINMALILDYNDPTGQIIRVDTRNFLELSQALHAKERL